MHKILLLGPQGSGKGTQAALLGQRLGIPVLSMGHLLREVIAEGGMLAERIRPILEAGELVSDDIAITVLDRKLDTLHAKGGYLLDGFPRNYHQFLAYDRYDQPTQVIVLDVPREESLRRLTQRIEKESRSDDTPEVMVRRLDIYEAETLPMLEEYTKRGLVRHVNGVGMIDEIAQRIAMII